MFVVTVDLYFLKHVKGGNKSVAWANILESVEYFSAVSTWLLLKTGLRTLSVCFTSQCHHDWNAILNQAHVLQQNKHCCLDYRAVSKKE